MHRIHNGFEARYGTNWMLKWGSEQIEIARESSGNSGRVLAKNEIANQTQFKVKALGRPWCSYLTIKTKCCKKKMREATVAFG